MAVVFTGPWGERSTQIHLVNTRDCPYLTAVMRILKKLNPIPGIKDFWSEFRRPNPHRWPILAVSMLITATLFYILLPKTEVRLPPEPEVTYITSFAPNRSDAEIIKSNIEAQKRKEAREKAEQEIVEQRKEFARTLGRATGVDTDAIERRIAEEKAQARTRAQPAAQRDDAN